MHALRAELLIVRFAVQIDFRAPEWRLLLIPVVLALWLWFEAGGWPLTADAAPEWVQAIGTVVAILVAAWIARHQTVVAGRQSLREDARHLDATIRIAHEASIKIQEAMIGVTENQNLFFTEAYDPAELERLHSHLLEIATRRFPTELASTYAFEVAGYLRSVKLLLRQAANERRVHGTINESYGANLRHIAELNWLAFDYLRAERGKIGSL